MQGHTGLFTQHDKITITGLYLCIDNKKVMLTCIIFSWENSLALVCMTKYLTELLQLLHHPNTIDLKINSFQKELKCVFFTYSSWWKQDFCKHQSCRFTDLWMTVRVESDLWTSKRYVFSHIICSFAYFLDLFTLLAMATVLMRHPIFIKCWSCHRNKAPSSVATELIHFEGIIHHTHTRKVFLLMYFNYDVLLSRQVLHHINESEKR